MIRYRMMGWGILFVVVVLFQVSTVPAGPHKDLTVEQAYPGLATGVLKSAKLSKIPNGVLLKTNGIEINKSLINEIVDKAEPKLRHQLEKNLFYLLEQETTKNILVKEARTAGIAVDDLTDAQVIKTYLNQIVQKAVVSEKEAKAFYAANKNMVGGMPFDQVKESIKNFLLQQKRLIIIDSYIRNLDQRIDIQISADWVKAQYILAKDNPVDRARMSGRPTMAEFGATGCIPCDMMQPILNNLRKKYPDKLNVVFVHVREEQILGARFGIRSIPVQVFFDRNGEEVFRHEGFLPESKITEVLSKMGVS